MRVALFIDGKNFYAGWKDRAGGRRIDFVEMAAWVVKRAGGQSLWGAYYYTGIESGTAAMAEGQLKLNSFLDMLEMQPGYFVMRFPRKGQTYACASCGAENRYAQEKELDTTMVADILRLAAIGAYDILVLMSGDADYTPAIEGVRALGRQAHVATWGGAGLSSRIRRVAYDHIDLLDGLALFERLEDGVPASGPISGPSVLTSDVSIVSVGRGYESPDEPPDEAALDTFIDEVRKAQERFHGGYVGANYFVTRWASDQLSASPEARRRILDALVEDGRIELYDAPDGKKAIRVADSTGSRSDVGVPYDDDVSGTYPGSSGQL